MRIRRLLSLLVLPLALAACENGAAPALRPEIDGLWLEVPAPGMANTRDQMVFGPGDRYARSLTVYRDASHGALTSSYREEGSFRLLGDRLELRVARETSWDEVIGGAPVVRNGPGTWADAGTVQISGNKMVRTFFTYPADAPIETTATYFRPGLD